jgi:hypothetical protein
MSSNTESVKGYALESVIINSSRFLDAGGLEIMGSVTDIEIFENLENNYLTGKIAITDSFRMFDRLDFQGAETITILLGQSENPNLPKSISKDFIVHKIISAKKINETSDVIFLNLIEISEYQSNLINVNRAYKGSPISIMSAITEEYLGKSISQHTSADTFQDKMKMIIPNLSPLRALNWIKSRLTTIDGLPTYLFSTFQSDKLFYSDLNAMLSQPPINPKMPFLHGAARDFSEITTSQKMIPIKAYSLENNDDMYNRIREGVVGAKYSYYDSLTGRYKTHSFDVHADAISQLQVKEYERPTFASNFEMDGRTLQSYESEHIAQFNTSGAYEDGTSKFRSIDQENEASDYNKRTIGRALKSFLIKTPITIVIDGRGFISGDYHRTIGNTIRVLFLANRPNETEVKIDTKKSGDYIIYAAKHTLAAEKYQLSLQCVKISSYNEDGIMGMLS